MKNKQKRSKIDPRVKFSETLNDMDTRMYNIKVTVEERAHMGRETTKKNGFLNFKGLRIEERLKRAFNIVIMIAAAASVIAVIGILVIATNYRKALNYYALPQGDIGMLMNKHAECRSAMRGIIGYEDQEEMDLMLEQHAEFTGIVGAANRHRQHIGGPLHGRTANLTFILHGSSLLFFIITVVRCQRNKKGRMLRPFSYSSVWISFQRVKPRISPPPMSCTNVICSPRTKTEISTATSGSI